MTGGVMDVLLCYGTETGNAEAIAQQIALRGKQYGFAFRVENLKDWRKVDLAAAKLVVFVCSTTGQGDPPLTCEGFFRFLRRKTHPKTLFAGVSYSVMALGDTNYDNFAEAGARLDRTMTALGAHRFLKRGEVDDGTGMEPDVEGYIEKLWPALTAEWKRRHCSAAEDSGVGVVAGSGAAEASTVVAVVADSGAAEASTAVAEHGTAVSSVPDAVAAPASADETPAVAASTPGVTTPATTAGVTESPTPQQSADKPKPVARRRIVRKGPVFVPASVTMAFVSETVVPDQDLLDEATGDAYAPLGVASWKDMARDGDRHVMYIELDVTGTPLEADWAPGDAVALRCPNRAADVSALLALLAPDTDPDAAVRLSPLPGTTASLPQHLPAHVTTLRHVLTYCVDIEAVPKKTLLRMLAEYTQDPSERKRLLDLTSAAGAAMYRSDILAAAPTLLQLLRHIAPSCRPPLPHLLESLPPLMPRYYSAATSPLAAPTRLGIVFAVVQVQRDTPPFARTHHGLCTSWLRSLCTGATAVRIPARLRRNADFALPADATRPLLMIGPGTGVAPFHAFLQHVHHAGRRSGDTWLFFGCRSAERDFLFADELNALHQAGTLTKLYTAFSRDPNDGVYVQQRMRDVGAGLVDAMLRQTASLYVCGDAANMLRDVRSVLAELLQEFGECADETAALQMMRQWQVEGRFVTDVWH